MHEMVNNPKHYESQGLTAIEVIEKFNLNFSLGNSIKYILRSGRKGNELHDEVQDLQKAIWYLNRQINFIKENV